MENKMLRDIYDTMLDSGDLEEVMPEATGIWENDKVKFAQIQDNLDDALIGKEREFQDLIDDYWEGEDEW